MVGSASDTAEYLSSPRGRAMPVKDFAAVERN